MATMMAADNEDNEVDGNGGDGATGASFSFALYGAYVGWYIGNEFVRKKT